MDCEELINEVKIGNLKYYNFYNTDLDMPTYFSVQHYLEHTDDNVDNYDQKIHALYLDIEVYKDDPDVNFDFNRSDFPISAISIYSTSEKIFKCYALKHPHLKSEINTDSNWYKDQLLEKKYIDITDNIEIFTFENELELITTCWKEIRKIDPMVLSGLAN